MSRWDTERLTLALAISLAAHLALFGSYELTREMMRLPWMQFLARRLVSTAPAPPQKQSREQPLEFVMVQNPSATAPANAKYYSSQNARAADSTHRNLDIAEIKGKQTDVPQTEQAPRPEFNKLHPSPQPQPSQPQPLPSTEPGDLTLATLEQLRPQQQPQQRPRTLSQVLPHQIPGLLMHQTGGAHEVGFEPSLDVLGTRFGAYDEAFIEAVTERWYQLLDSQQFALDRTGKVMLCFHLNYDGTITDMQVLDNSVGVLLGTLCEDAINDPSPYAPWPEDMRRMIGANYREITFTFYYY
jgi:hypothetical protein